MIRWISLRWLLCFALLCVVTAPAFADTRAVYTIKGIPVDEQAPSVIEAQQRALSYARLEGARELIRKITLADDRAAAGDLLFIDQALAERLAAAVDVEEESRGGGRYRGVLSVVLNPRMVRAFLDERGVPYLDRQAPTALMVPIGGGEASLAWLDSWPDEAPGELAPYVTALGAIYGANSDWTDIAVEAEALGAQRGVLAELRGREGSYAVQLTLVTPQGRVPLGTTNRVPTLDDAVTAASAYLSEIWKRETIVRSDIRSLVEASVLYTSVVEWNTLRSALIRSPLVSDFQTVAIARDGALIRFAFAGDDVERLKRDLRQRGVALETDIGIWVLTSAVSGIR